jgi:hypothetical protein
MAAAMDLNAVSDVVNTAWGQELVDELGEYITILCLSPHSIRTGTLISEHA